MTKKEREEIDKLEDFCLDLCEKLNGDPCVEYCEDDEEPEDIFPQIRRAGDQASFDVANKRLCELKEKRKAEREKRKKK